METATTECPKCNSPLQNVVSGSVCPRGCGGLWPRVADASRDRVIDMLPEATKLPFRAKSRDCHNGLDVFVVPGLSGLWRKQVRTTSSLTKLPEDHIVARLDGKAIQLARWDEVNEAIGPAFGIELAKVLSFLTRVVPELRDGNPEDTEAIVAEIEGLVACYE